MKIKNKFNLINNNSYRISATARKVFFPETEADFIKIFKDEKNRVIIGAGNNIILSKQYYEDEFIIIDKHFSTISVKDEIIEAEAGCDMRELSELAQERGLSGLEVFYDIPSSLGGAVVMNAGANGEEIKDILLKVKYLDLEDNTIKEIQKDAIGFEYRNSFFQKSKNKIVLKAWLKLTKSDKNTIKQKMLILKERRYAKQPKEYPNAGSVFKRPRGYYVGAIIEELGLKGFTVGGAQISKKHGGFIINYNNATGKDILSIIDYIQDKVFEKYSFTLEVEQRVL